MPSSPRHMKAAIVKITNDATDDRTLVRAAMRCSARATYIGSVSAPRKWRPFCTAATDDAPPMCTVALYATDGIPRFAASSSTVV